MNKLSVRSAVNTSILALITWLLFTGHHSLAEAASTLTLEQPAHFMTSDGNDVMVEAATYEVDTLVGSRLRLNMEGGETVFLEAHATTHSEEVEAPLAITVRSEDPDVVHIVLLLPNGQALDAPGSISGTRSRGFANLLASTAQIQFAVAQQGPVVRDHRTQSMPVPPSSAPSSGTGGPSSVVGIVPGRIATVTVGSWRHGHGNAGNTGFANVLTAPGTLPTRKVSGLGNYAPGAGPVIAEDGTVYLGNSQGQLRALTPAGDQKWMRDTPGRKIVASPVVGADGSIYVVGTSVARDHRKGGQFLRYFANLYRFDQGGAMHWVRPFPEKSQGAGATSAAPNIWRSGATEVIIVPVLYYLGGYNLTLVAFSTTGALLFEQKVTGWAAQVTGSGSWGEAFCAYNPLCFNQWYGLTPTELAPGPNQLPKGVEPPMPSVGIFAGTGGGAPLVVVSDNYQNIVGYSFSPTQGFQETFRKHLTKDWLRMSSPALMRDGHSVIRGNGSKQAWVLFGGPNAVNWTEVSTPLTGATPTLTVDGRIVMVDRGGGLTVIGTYPDRSVLNRVQLEAESIAPAAASCSHVFVSTASAFVTLDAKATAVVAKFDWQAGGLSSPAIGPDGRVFALAGDSLYIFPAPPRPKLGGMTSCQEGGGLVSPSIERSIRP